MNNVKEINHDTCRSRSDLRSAKDLYRISTSNLNKKELEDAYYSLFDNNFELKKTVNAQKDQIKVLTTRISRLTQKNIYSPQKGCNKNTLNEYKEIILDLKQANGKLVERVRLLNMQLCSAKQFVKRSPLQTTRCQNCANIRNSSSITLLNTKRSQQNLRTKSTASQYEPDITPVLLDETIKEAIPNNDQEECTQNKCKTAVEELQHKIEELQLQIEDLRKELANSAERYTSEHTKYADYEHVVSGLKAETLRVRAQARGCEEQLRATRTQYRELLGKLRAAQAQSETVSLELIIEKQKSRELETQLKAAEISHNIVEALSQAARANESRELERVESLTAVRDDESHELMGIESFTPDRAKSSHIPVRVSESLTAARVDKSPMKVNESLTATRFEESPVKLGGTPNKEQSDDSGYLEATNRFLELSSDIKLDRITEQTQEDKTQKTLSDDYKRKKRRGKSKKNKRDSSVESSVDGHPSSMSRDVAETVIESRDDMEQSRKKILQDVGVQSAVVCVSRAVGGVLEDNRTDAAVQAGDSLGANPVIDTRTHSVNSGGTYRVHAPAAAPANVPAPAAVAASAPATARDNTYSEISSISDSPAERNLSRSDYISPGEAVSSSDAGASSWSELSEGEVIPTHTQQHKLSYGEIDASLSIGERKPPLSPSARIDRAMRMAREEADRVARLLAGRPVDLCGVTVNPLVLLRHETSRSRLK